MALISIKGGTNKKRKRVYAVAHWAAYQLMHWKMADNIVLHIDIKKIDVCGYCGWEDDNIKPREFDIEINNNLIGVELDLTVLHEMVHVKQYAKDEFRERFRFGYKLFWKRSKKNYAYLHDSLDSPWEKEAYNLQEVLYKRWIDE